jgi:hypothetical protein
LAGLQRKSKTDVAQPQPNDVVTAMGTLIGLILTAFAFVSNIAISQGTFPLIAGLELVVLGFFVLTALLATLASVTDRWNLWEVAKGLYPANWSALAVGIGSIFLIMSYPKHPPSNVLLAVVILFVGGVAGAWGLTQSVNSSKLLGSMRVEAAKARASRAAKMKEVAKVRASDATTVREEDLGVSDRFLQEYTLLQKVVEDMANTAKIPETLPMRQTLQLLHKQEKIKKKEDLDLFASITKIRNQVVHGIAVSDSDLNAGIEVSSRLRSDWAPQ